MKHKEVTVDTVLVVIVCINRFTSNAGILQQKTIKNGNGTKIWGKAGITTKGLCIGTMGFISQNFGWKM